MLILSFIGKFLERVVYTCSLLFLAANLVLNSSFNLRSDVTNVQKLSFTPGHTSPFKSSIQRVILDHVILFLKEMIVLYGQ